MFTLTGGLRIRLSPRMQRLLYGLPIEYPEIVVFRMTDDSMYLFRPNANLEAVPGQRPLLWAFVPPSSSSMGFCVSVVLFHGGLCFRPLGAGFCAKPSSLVAVAI